MLLNLAIGDTVRKSYHLDAPRLASCEIEKGASRLHRLNSNMDNATSTTNICDEEASTRRRNNPGTKFVAFVSRNRRHLALVLAATLLVAVIAASVIVTVQRTQAQRLRSSMNETVDPCDDFYEFACQRWDANEGGPIWQSTADAIKKDFVASRDSLLEGHFAEPNKAESYLIGFVQHCQNDEPRRTSQGMDPVLVELKSMGGYPLFQSEWKEDNYCWMQAEARLAHMGYNQALLQARFDVDAKRRGQRILVLGLQPLMFTRAVLDKEDTVTGIRTFLRNVALRYRKLHDDAEKLDNEQDLQNQTTVGQKPQRVTVEELSRQIPEIKWLEYLQKLTSPALKKAGLREFSGTDSVMVLNLDALRALAKFLGSCRNNTRYIRAMANYIGYKFLINSVFFSPQPEIRDTYYNYTMQQGVQFNRAAKCKELVETLRLVPYHHYFRTNRHKFDQQRALDNAPKNGPFLERLVYHRVHKYNQQVKELFQHRNTEYVNYGTVGFVAGHEIIHAFDDRGITIDEHGVDFEKDQWSNGTRQEFNQRMQSLIDFYAKTFQVNGSHTRNENLADTSAARFSFKSYRREQGPTKACVLPGFEKYTNDQLYFLSFASIWCNNNKYDPNSIYSNNHARVNGPLMNLDEFAEAFQCPHGSKMNPMQKAPVWNV
ncbi:hypothetical protein HPB50_000721 [Hyalomma asiaticum]|uniref:Uncharacterized protein n=1 Tax=Hyalomma asiaticum TaxID=266040 RepID=A0ACB7SUL1_HYAAI|nr:hypothetical protein HPB50_000721 [Hyalomma asiaticum]